MRAISRGRLWDGEQYVRDLIRLVVEVGGDLRYQLPARRRELMDLVRDQDKATRWLKGAASMAGTTARKATQHAFLSHIPIPLR